jgi:hypothetical protein
MTNDPNVPPYQQFPPQPQPPQFGQSSQQPGNGKNQQLPPQFQQVPYPPQMFGPPPQPQPRQGPKPPKGPFGVSFWIVGSLLALVVLSNTVTGHGETILIVLGVAAVITGLYSLIYKKRSWAFLPNRNFAVAVAVAGAASLLTGGIAAGVSESQEETAAQPVTVTSAELEADAAAKLATREDAVVKAEAAVKARETAVGGAEAAVAATTIKEGTWTVGMDIVPGTYRTTTALTSSCYWAITRTGSNGGDILENDNVKGGFPMVTLSDGQTFESSRCGSWAKQ